MERYTKKFNESYDDYSLILDNINNFKKVKASYKGDMLSLLKEVGDVRELRDIFIFTPPERYASISIIKNTITSIKINQNIIEVKTKSGILYELFTN